MLPSEIILILIVTVYLGLNRFFNKKFNKFYVIGLLAFILTVHLVIDGFRWQMIPAYLIWLIAMITALRQSLHKTSTFAKVFKSMGLIVLLGLAILLPSVLPVFKLPQTTGPFIVGTQDIFLEFDREEVITDDSSDSRSLMIKVFYPSKETNGKKDLYVDKAGRSGFAQKYGLPPSILNYLDKVETNVFKNIQIADEKFPVLIFSHGYNSIANGYYALLSELVSHGYIVFAINHTYESTGTTFLDGTQKYFNYQYASKIEDGSWDMMVPVIEAFQSELSFEDRHPIVQKGLTSYYVRDMVERWAEDIVDVVDHLEEWNDTDFFKGNLDLNNLGVLGHSRGGSAAGEAMLLDHRIKAGANIDGDQWGRIVDTLFQKPFLLLSADWPADHIQLNKHAYVNKSTSYFYEVTVLQAGHSSFMDIPYMIPLKFLNEAGEIDPDLAIEISRRVIISFFDKHLKNKEVDLNALNSEYELLEILTFKGDSIVRK